MEMTAQEMRTEIARLEEKVAKLKNRRLPLPRSIEMGYRARIRKLEYNLKELMKESSGGGDLVHRSFDALFAS